MPATNGRPLPWHDTAHCTELDPDDGGYCGGPMVPVEHMHNGHGGPRGSRIACAACGHGRVGSAEDVAKTLRSAKAWEMLEAGLIHPDRCCARCFGPLQIDRQRHCSKCVERDNAERQAPLFPEVRP